jgi:hypothetical protein
MYDLAAIQIMTNHRIERRPLWQSIATSKGQEGKPIKQREFTSDGMRLTAERLIEIETSMCEECRALICPGCTKRTSDKDLTVCSDRCRAIFNRRTQGAAAA